MEVSTNGYQHYHGVVYLATAQRGLTFLHQIFGRTAFVTPLRRYTLDEYRWRTYYRKGMPSVEWEFDSDNARVYYETLQHNGSIIVYPEARPCRKERNMKNLAQLGTKLLWSGGGSQRSSRGSSRSTTDSPRSSRQSTQMTAGSSRHSRSGRGTPQASSV